MIVDFHVHSTASDGTFTPRELAEKSRRFAAIALTDHDNCDGCGEWTGVKGVELSIEPGAGFDKFHLLALGIDPENARLKSLLQRILEGRNARNRRIRANFLRLGIEMPLDPRPDSARDTDVVARPHYARWLMEHGYVASVREAFERYLTDDSPKATRCYEERWHPPQEDAFAAVHAAGGICVMAHPKYWRRIPDAAAEERELAALKEKGLDGLECLYQANTQEENVRYTMMAVRTGLLKSAGSDFHGANKPTIPLGMEVGDTFIAPLLERLSVFPPCFTRGLLI